MYQYKVTFANGREVILFADDIADLLKILHKTYPRQITRSIKLVKDETSVIEEGELPY